MRGPQAWTNLGECSKFCVERCNGIAMRLLFVKNPANGSPSVASTCHPVEPFHELCSHFHVMAPLFARTSLNCSFSEKHAAFLTCACGVCCNRGSVSRRRGRPVPPRCLCQCRLHNTFEDEFCWGMPRAQMC